VQAWGGHWVVDTSGGGGGCIASVLALASANQPFQSAELTALDSA